eukprot:4319595-Prymnesium_polylepis.1
MLGPREPSTNNDPARVLRWACCLQRECCVGMLPAERNLVCGSRERMRSRAALGMLPAERNLVRGSRESMDPELRWA